MTATNKLALELLAAAAANQTLTNTTFAQLNQLVMPAVVDKDLAAPPGSPANEALYIVAASATGAWASKDGQLAYWLTSTNAWQFIVPREGFLVHVNDEDEYYKFDGSAWGVFSGAGGGFTGGTLTSALNEAPITTLASAATINVGAELANTINISGTTTVTSLGTIASGATRQLVFQAALTLTHNATSLILPTGANIVTAAGDAAEFVSLGGGNWRCVRYERASGQALAAPGGGFTGGTLTSALNEAPAVTLASASTVNIGAAAANTISITGTTTITAFDTIANGAVRLLEFAGALTLTHNGTSLILPTGANIVTAAGDVAEFRSLGSGNWRCVGYLRADGTPLAGGGGGGGLTNFTEAKNTAAPNATVPAVSLSVTITETNGDVAIVAKGTGATLAQVPNDASSGGNKRGTYATDFQKSRGTAAQVASGSYSVLCGGRLNQASAQEAVVVGGQSNIASGSQSFVGGGVTNTASGSGSVILGGGDNTASGLYSAVLGGSTNTASGSYSVVLGGYQATTRGIYGAEARASGQFVSQGDAQRGRYIKRRLTTTATPATLGTDGSAGGAINQVILPNNSAYAFEGMVVARENATGDCGKWLFGGLIRRGANAASTEIVGTVTLSLDKSTAGAASWVVAVTADTTNGGITVTVTGEESHTIRWVADIETVEVVG